MRDDRPFGGSSQSAAMYFYSRDRTGGHLAGYSGILQVDAYAGFNDLYAAGRKPYPPDECRGVVSGRSGDDGAPVPGQKLVETGSWVIADPDEHIGEPSAGIDVIEPGGDHK